ncbi:MAG TPA: AsmA-like C-terminal region-containing protein [Steroidobacteraceae bacterium]|nr:AsmA-like C-terminal region-containing protein [Steroidobacteraceae bacterium]
MRPADAAAGTDAPAAAQPGAAGARTLVRVTLATLAGASLLAAVILLAYALAAARVPQQRATLESLVRAETGLDVRFDELRLRWGWYGPEAAFEAVELHEPGEARALLTAPQLVLGVDLWRMLRSGDLAISRITLVDPDIDVRPGPPVRGARPARAPASASPTRLLARWRGTRIDVEGGRLRAEVAGVPLDAGIRRIELRRAGAEWTAEALLTLPEELGTTAEAGLRLQGDAAQPADLAGTLTLGSRRLQLAGWRSLLKSAPLAPYLPDAGSADVTVQLDLAQGAVQRAQGTVAGAGLEWPAVGPAAGLALDELHAEWQLVRNRAGWHFGVEPLELGAGSPRAALSIDAAADGGWVRGRLQRAPAAVLAGLTRGVLPQLRVSGVELRGMVREARFDWSAARPPDARLLTTAELDDLSVIPPGHALALAGLTAHLSGTGASLEAALDASAAQATFAADPARALAPIGLHAQLALTDNGRTWRLSTRELEIRQGDSRLAASGTLTGEDSGAHPRIDARAAVSGAPIELVRAALGARTLAALGAAAGELTAGRIVHGQLVARGPLDEPLPWSGARRTFAGSLELTGASLAGAADRPDLRGLDARIDWRGARVRVRVDGAAAGRLRLSAARGEWDARDASLERLAGRLSGNLVDALAWLRDHPQLEPYAPGIDGIALSGDAVFDFELRRAGNRAGGPRAPRFATRLSALLDGAQLRPVAGLPGIEGLRGTLAFADGHLQRSTVTGRWLGGPIALSVGERRERGATAVAISGKGVLDVPEAMAAATGLHAGESPLRGNAEWSADLRLLPGTNGGRASWRARADTSLAGVASSLPEPLAKASGSVLPLHIELLGTEDTAELHVALAEWLRGVAAVSRRGDLWRIERGAVTLAAGTPTMPTAPVVEIEGTISRLDLPAYALLWRELARHSAWPALRVELTANELLAGELRFPDLRVAAQVGPGSGEAELESPDFQASVHWPGVVDAAHPVSAHVERLDLAQLAADRAAPAAALLAALGSDTRLSIGDLRWQGRPLGGLDATLAARAGELEVQDLRVSGAGDEARGKLKCRDGVCRASFSLQSHDAAATLTRLGFRSDLGAARAVASGQLAWPAAGSAILADAKGELHVELDDGLARSVAADAPGGSLGLLAVPGLIAGMGLPQLPFTRLTADFAVADGQAATSDLHLDGDTEILMRGRIGLLARDYDAEVRVLKGEERLPAAVRRLGPGPRVAALWMSLRELLTGVNRERATLRLHGTWDDPMVSP